ncbi:MAG: hypothetical protein NC416_16365 [Eubacterium sp.]|nr:hypothetical protein [Eubacterium sp.]
MKANHIVPALNMESQPVARETKTGVELIPLDNLQFVDANLPDFALKVPEAERAIDIEDEKDVYGKLQEMGVLSPVHDMVNIRNCFNDSLFANRYQDEDGKKYIQFCQRYDDGRYSPIMQLPQADFMIAAQYSFVATEIKDARIKSRVAGFFLKVLEEYFGIFDGDDDEQLNIADILNVLYYSRKQLPLYREDAKEMDAVELYQLIERYIPECESHIHKLFERESYYMLDEEGVIKLANTIGMRKLQLLKLMKKYGFLYLTEASHGYQANIRFTKQDGESFTEWVYCIFKFAVLAGIQKTDKKIEKKVEF